MTATKLFPSGAWQVSDIIDGQLVTKTYYDFSKREALAQFRDDTAPKKPNDTKPMLHAEHLEQLVDAYGLPRLLATLAEIADEKANHVQQNWQDYSLASEWAKIGQKLANLGHTIPNL